MATKSNLTNSHPALAALIRELRSRADKEKAAVLRRFFKTGKGEYGEGDEFLGVVVPIQRKIAKKYLGLGFIALACLIRSKVHEYRFTALVILCEKYKRGTQKEKQRIAQFFLCNRRYINNWDLIDTSTPHILGDYALTQDTKVLFKLARSKNFWERRIAVLATFPFIKAGRYDEILRIAELLLKDNHVLIHKAVGWALREVGKKSITAEEAFLQKYASRMPRAMLRYAIERFQLEKKTRYLRKAH